MGETFEMSLFAMAHGGDAIGRHEGRVVFVPYTMPGERVQVEIIEDHKRYARGRLLEVLEPAPARVEPPCPYFGEGKCGGCQFQHIAYPTQVQIKGRIVADQLQRIGKFDEPPVLEPIPDETGWEYRNRALFRTTELGYPGFLSAGSDDVYPVDDCLIVHPLLSQLYRSLHMKHPDVEKMELRVGTATGDLMVVLQTYDEEPPSLEVDFPLSIVQVRHDTTPTPLVGLDYITEVVHGREFRISATSFFQINSEQAGRLVDLILDALALEGAEIVLDAYCGVGLFTSFIAERASLVIGIEINPDAVDDAVHNLADAENVTLLEGQVEHALSEIEEKIDAVVLDPPRGGVEKEALDAVAVHSPERIVYVSCDPATFARDARRLVRKGYTMEWVQPVDLFPQTYHVETVSLLTRASS
jgi:23S rRNA (uracil1939-C5)-methyltransferase